MTRKRRTAIAAVIALMVLLCGCGTAPQTANPASALPSATAAPPVATASCVPTPTATAVSTAAPTAQAYPFQDANLPVAERVEDLLSRMTPEEKAGQMVQGERGSTPPAAVTKYALGSMLSGGDSAPGDNTPKGWLGMTRAYQDAALACRLPIPLLYGVDAVHGHSSAAGAVLFPHNVGLGAADAPELMEQMGKAVAAEMLSTGVPWNFAPCVATAQDPRWGRTYESFYSDPALVIRLSLPFARGLAAGGVLPTAKHFVADGATLWGTSAYPGYSIDQGDASIDEATMRSVHLEPYRQLVKAGVPVVMASFSSVNGVRMHANRYLLTDVLKGELGFKGFVVSDWQGLNTLEGATYADKVAAAVKAGIDMLMECGNYMMAVNALNECVKDERIPMARVDDAVSRILRVKFEAGLFEDPYLEKRSAAEFGSAGHRALAAELVSRSLVLLKNDHGALPFTKGEKILVIGPAADDLGAQCGGWSCKWQGWTGDNDLTAGTTILKGLQEYAAKAGAVILTDPAQVQQADAVLLVVGEKPYAEGVGDTPDLSLTGKLALEGNAEAMELAKSSGKPVAALIVAGRPLVIAGEMKQWDAAVMAWLPGTEGEGIAPVLFGERDFSGKLPMPWYRNVDDIGKAGAKPQFPIGYGLAYQ